MDKETRRHLRWSHENIGFIGACVNASKNSIDSMCQSFKIANTIMSRTVICDITGEYVAQYSIDLMYRCPPAHNLDFHFAMSPSGFRFRFMNHTMGIACFPTEIDLSGTTFQCLQSM